MKFKLYFLSFLGFIFFNQILSIKSSQELNLNSIIKIFCIENVKSEIRKANLIYTETFGNKVCDCYIKNINNKKFTGIKYKFNNKNILHRKCKIRNKKS